MADEKLRPCPCGGKAYINMVNRERWQGRSGAYISCQRKSCRLTGTVFSTRAKAVAAWNTRPLENALADALKEIATHVCSCMSTTEDDWHSPRCYVSIARAALKKVGRE